MSDQLRSSTGFQWQNYVQAASYCLNNDVELEKGLAWAEAAIANTSNFTTLSTKAGLLTKLGRFGEERRQGFIGCVIVSLL